MCHVPSQLVCLRHLFQMVPVSSVCEDTDYKYPLPIFLLDSTGISIHLHLPRVLRSRYSTKPAPSGIRPAGPAGVSSRPRCPCTIMLGGDVLSRHKQNTSTNTKNKHQKHRQKGGGHAADRTIPSPVSGSGGRSGWGVCGGTGLPRSCPRAFGKLSTARGPRCEAELSSGSLSLVAGRRRAWLSRRRWMDVGNRSKHSVYEETNRWIPQSLGIRGPHIPVPSPDGPSHLRRGSYLRRTHARSSHKV